MAEKMWPEISYAKKCDKLCRNFDLCEKLGSGGFGQVIKGKCKNDEENYAIKLIPIKHQTENHSKYKREAQHLSRLDHPNVVRYYSSWIEEVLFTPDEFEHFKSENSIWGTMSSSKSLHMELSSLTISDGSKILIEELSNTEESEEDYVQFRHDKMEIIFLAIQMELCTEQSLRTAIDKNLYLETERRERFFREICEGLHHIHQQGIIHRDLKPENIFITGRDTIKIGDFGLAKRITLNTINDVECNYEEAVSLSEACGSSIYIAPEIKKQSSKITAKVDIYSLGVIYFEMNCRSMTLSEKFEIFPLSAKKWKEYKFKFSEKTKSKLKNLLNKYPHKRQSSEELANEMKLKSSVNDVKELLLFKDYKSNKWQSKVHSKKLQNMTPEMFMRIAKLEKIITRIFEAHGAVKMALPMFSPPFDTFYPDDTRLMNEAGNLVSLANNSRIGFAHYIATHDIESSKRYSVDRCFRHGFYLPYEKQEFSFECVKRTNNWTYQDVTNEVEMLYIAKQVCQEILEDKSTEVEYVINHSTVFESFAEMLPKSSFEILQKLALKDIIKPDVAPLDASTKKIIKKYWKFIKIFPICNLKKYDISDEIINFLDAMTIILSDFGFDLDKVFFCPMLLTNDNSSGFMYKVVVPHNDGKLVVANGGRFDSTVKACYKYLKKPFPKELSVAGITFSVDNILQFFFKYEATFDVLVADLRWSPTGIKLYTMLQERNIKCDFVTNGPIILESRKQPFVLFRISSDFDVTVDHVKIVKPKFGGNLTWETESISDGQWNMEKTVHYIETELDTFLLNIHKEE